MLIFVLFSSCGLWDTETFFTFGDRLVHCGSLGKTKAFATVVTKQVIRKRRQHCSYSKSMHVHRTPHQPWCETRRAGHRLKLPSRGSWIKLTGSAKEWWGDRQSDLWLTQCCSAAAAIINELAGRARARARARARQNWLPGPSQHTDGWSVSNKNSSSAIQFCVCSWGIELGNKLSKITVAEKQCQENMTTYRNRNRYGDAFSKMQLKLLFLNLLLIWIQ